MFRYSSTFTHSSLKHSAQPCSWPVMLSTGNFETINFAGQREEDEVPKT